MSAFKRELKSGTKWRYQGYFKGQRYTGPTIYDTEKEALKAEKVYLASLQGDTLQAMMKEYLGHLRVNTTNSGYHKHSERVIQKFIDFAGQPDLSVKEVTREMVEKFKNAEASKRWEAGESPHSVNYALRILKAYFYYAIKVKMVDMRNPVSGVKYQALSDERKYIPTDKDLERLRGKLDRTEALLVDFCRETGCRINEALRLSGKGVHKDTVTLWTRKSKNSNLTPRVVPRPYCLSEETIPGDPEERIFSRWKAQPRFLEKAVLKLMEEQEEFTGKPMLPHSFNWHNLRHKAASEWASQGMVLVEIMTRLGHSNIETTQNYLQSLGFTTLKYTEGNRPDYLGKPTSEDMEEAEKDDAEQDEERFKWLAEKVGPELASDIVYGFTDDRTEEKLRKRGFTPKDLRDSK